MDRFLVDLSIPASKLGTIQMVSKTQNGNFLQMAGNSLD
jgi:hypothetical protein